jgi:hypothetical protein
VFPERSLAEWLHAQGRPRNIYCLDNTRCSSSSP